MLVMSSTRAKTPAVYRPLPEITLSDIPTGFEEEFPLSFPLLLQRSRNANQLTAFDIVQHDDICTSLNRFVSLGFGLYFHIY